MIINGKEIADQITDEIKKKISTLTKRPPCIGVIQVGDNFASQTYIKIKKRTCEMMGIKFSLFHFSETEKEKTILDQIEKLNSDDQTDAILVQMPLPRHMNSYDVFAAIDPTKDVDGFNPCNMGKLLLGDDRGFVPCTPLGIKLLLQNSNISCENKHVVIVGRSNIVGKPLGALLVQKKPSANATVTIAHSYTKNLYKITKSADILIAAIGKPKFITKEMVSPNTIVIDVGINRLQDPSGKIKIVGDVDFENVSLITSAITPVPKGVGPMTIACLLKNILKSYELHI